MIYQKILLLENFNNIVYTSGTWDLFHIGHLNMIKRAAKLGDCLIVGISTDELVCEYKNRLPAIPFKERLQIIGSLRYPDLIVAQHKQFHIELMSELNVSTIVMGDDWKDSDNSDLIRLKDQFDVVFLPRTEFISSTELKKKVYTQEIQKR